MNTNGSVFSVVLTLHSLELSPMSLYPAFIFGIVAYLIILLSNLTIAATICLNKNLHKPMYILLVNLQIIDIIGATSLFPHLLYSVWSQNRLISYLACWLQGLFIHLYGGGCHFVLMAMAFDRYIAICYPLRYGAIMSSRSLVRILTLMWLSHFPLVFALFCLLLPQTICKTDMADLTCNNPSLMKIMCEDTTANNIYGWFLICIYFGLSFSFVAFTYIHILVTCVTKKQSDSKRKAVQTCGTHLVVFLFLEFNTFFPLVAHRLEIVPAQIRRMLTLSILVFPPIVNPLIYGYKTKSIRRNVMNCFRNNINKVK